MRALTLTTKWGHAFRVLDNGRLNRNILGVNGIRASEAVTTVPVYGGEGYAVHLVIGKPGKPASGLLARRLNKPRRASWDSDKRTAVH